MFRLVPNDNQRRQLWNGVGSGLGFGTLKVTLHRAQGCARGFLGLCSSTKKGESNLI